MEEKKVTKPAHTYGKWVQQKTVSTILLCECGAKYIKTRELQITCLACVSKRPR